MQARYRRFLVCLAVAAAVTVAGQPLDRLTGKVLTDSGAPAADAEVRVEAMFGFAGSDFLGQRTFAARTGASGEWSLLAFKAGIWVFDTSAPGLLPDAIALPFNLVAPPSKGIDRLVPSWHPILRLQPLPSGEMGQMLVDAAIAARTQRPERAVELLALLQDTRDVEILTAAGTICLLMRDATVARPFFRRALERDPKSFRAALGMGSTALMQRDVDTAARAFGEARSLTRDKDERGYLSAAIVELNKAHFVMKGTY
jgi:hypothetical protein